MQTEIIEVKYVNQPKDGKQYGSIKGTNNESFPVKADRIREFAPGNRYELAIVEGNNGFKNIIGVKLIVPEPAQQVNYTQRPDARREGETFTEPHRNGATLTTAAAQPKQNAQQYYQPRPTAPRDAKRMALCSWMNAFIQTGRVERSKEAVVETIMMLSDAYDETIGQDDQA
jgi:hypothetical protein